MNVIICVCLSIVKPLQNKQELTQEWENGPAEVISQPVQAVSINTKTTVYLLANICHIHYLTHTTESPACFKVSSVSQRISRAFSSFECQTDKYGTAPLAFIFRTAGPLKHSRCLYLHLHAVGITQQQWRKKGKNILIISLITAMPYLSTPICTKHFQDHYTEMCELKRHVSELRFWLKVFR